MGIIDVVIPDGTRGAAPGIPFLVEHLGKGGDRILDHECLVGEIHEDHGNPVLAEGKRGCLCSRLGAHLLGGEAHLARFFPFCPGRLFRRTEEAVLSLGDDLPVVVGDVVVPLVTMDPDEDGGAVRLDYPDSSRIGGDGGQGMEDTHKECEGYKDLLHGRYWILTMKPVPPSPMSQAFPSSTLRTLTEMSAVWVATCLT